MIKVNDMTLQITVDKDVKKRVEKLADKYGLSVSSYCRAIILRSIAKDERRDREIEWQYEKKKAKRKR